MPIEAVRIAETSPAVGAGSELGHASEAETADEFFGRREGDYVELYRLGGDARGVVPPCGRFAVPWPKERSVHWTWAPDLTWAVFNGPESIRAVAADGRTLWEYPHTPWEYGCSGSCAITAGGRRVWTTVPSPEGDLWLLLDADSGAEIGRTPLLTMAVGSVSTLHPDGEHVALSVGEGQDGSYVFWGRADEAGMVVWQVVANDPCLLDVAPDGSGFLTIGANDDVLRFQRFTDSAVDSVLGESALPGKGPDDDESTLYWDMCGGYLDGATALVATYHDAEDEQEPCRHWLLDLATRELRGPVRYPRGSAPAGFRSLGDGTWVTGSAGGGLVRWSFRG